MRRPLVRGLVICGVAAFLAISGEQTLAQQADFKKGQALAVQTLERLEQPEGAALLANKPPLGYVIAEGDSWFDYPGIDVLGALEGQTLPNKDYYKVYSAAKAGDTVESMAYDNAQLEGYANEFKKLLDAGKQNDLKAILLSGGGNDIAGTEFHMLLNHAASSSTSVIDNALADAFIERVGKALESLIGTSVRYAQRILGRTDVPIVIHGYAYPVPDGRPFGFGWFLPGPWLQPGFSVKGYPNQTMSHLAANTDVMKTLIDKFNTRIQAIPDRLKGDAMVRVVDMRTVLSREVAGNVYRGDWSNELHPTDAAFKKVAAGFHAKILNP